MWFLSMCPIYALIRDAEFLSRRPSESPSDSNFTLSRRGRTAYQFPKDAEVSSSETCGLWVSPTAADINGAEAPKTGLSIFSVNSTIDISNMATDYKFEGWMGLDSTASEGNMVWQEFTPKKWEETDIDIKISHCGVCGSDLHTLRSGWVS